MRYKTHPYVGYIMGGIALACLVAMIGVTLVAVATAPRGLFVLACWAMGLFIAATLCGIVAVNTWPTYAERKRAVAHAQRPIAATKWLRRLSTPHRH